MNLQAEGIEPVVTGALFPDIIAALILVGQADGEERVVVQGLARVGKVQIQGHVSGDACREGDGLFDGDLLPRHPVAGVAVDRPNSYNFAGGVGKDQFCVTGILNGGEAFVVQGKFDIEVLSGFRIAGENGAMEGTLSLKDAGSLSEMPPMFRFGLVMQLPYTMDKSLFYGRGPIESYCDRKESQRIGIYSQNADEQFYPYIRPQETGTKADMRWWQQTDGEGFGLKVTSDAPFYASALHYDIETLNDGDDKEQRHPEQMDRSRYTNLFLDGEHAGVGGVDSWSRSARALPQYQVKYGEKTFTVVFSPR